MFTLILTMGGFYATNSVNATASPLSLDGVGVYPICHVSQSAEFFCLNQQLLTTTHGHDVIILEVVDSASGSASTISSVIDSSGLVFTPRISFTSNAKIWEYYARATSPLTSDNITVVFSSFDEGWVGLQAIAVHGANTNAIFDQNPSIPALVSCSYTCGPPGAGSCSAGDSLNPGTCSASIQTSTIDFVVAIVAINDAVSCGGYGVRGDPRNQNYYTPIGFTSLAGDGKFEVDYEITPTPHTTVVFDCNATDVDTIVLDAISFKSEVGTVEPYPPVWHPVASYEGGCYCGNGGGFNTSAFDIKNSQFRLNWSYIPPGSYYSPDPYEFAVYVNPLSSQPQGSSTLAICETNNATIASTGCNYTGGPYYGTAIIRQGPGSFYLQVIGSSVNWSITVEDYF